MQDFVHQQYHVQGVLGCTGRAKLMHETSNHGLRFDCSVTTPESLLKSIETPAVKILDLIKRRTVSKDSDFAGHPTAPTPL